MAQTTSTMMLPLGATAPSFAPDVQRPSLGCDIKWKPGNEPVYFPR